MIRSLVIVALIAAAFPALAQAPMQIDCTGPFAKDADEAALVQRFGRHNVKATRIDGAEGETIQATVVYPNDPKRRIEIVWHDEKRRRRPASISVRRGAEWTIRPVGAAARTISANSSLQDVEEANERPFSLMGFGWDMGGYTAGWGGGKLGALEGGCDLSVRFDPDPTAKSAPLGKVSGERKFSSSSPAIKVVKPSVSQISLGWPE